MRIASKNCTATPAIPESAIWHTMRGDMELCFENSNRQYRRLKGPSDLQSCCNGVPLCLAPPQQRLALWDHEIQSIMLEVKAVTCGRRFFTTKKEYSGLAPQQCRNGDLVVVLAGGSTPYIICRASQGSSPKKYHAIVGDAYVHGIMDGEALKLPDGTERELEEVLLI